MRRARAGAIGLLALGAAAAASAGSEGPARLFPSEAEVATDGASGFVRLALPPEVLAACRPDLSDLRLFDAAGREIPFVVDAGARAEPAAERRRVAAEVRAVDRFLETPRDGAPSVREVYEIAPKEAKVGDAAAPAPGAGPEGAELAWSLEVRSQRSRFVRQLRVSRVRSDGSLETVADAAPLFRLASDTARNRVAIGVLPEHLRVEITGREDFYLEPRFAFRGERERAQEARLEVPLSRVGGASANGRTVIELARPPGLVPDALRLATATPSFSRRVAAVDLRHGARERYVGKRRLFRVPLEPPVEELELPVDTCLGDRVRLEIEDGDAPPLEGVAVSALLRQPSVLFAATPSEGGAGPVLRFGGGRAQRPRYDVADLWPEIAGRSGGSLAEVPAATAALGPIRANPLHDAAPALAFAQQPGAPVDARLYARRRNVSVPPSPDGLVRIALELEDAAAARADLADLRVVDGEGRQWPYLLQADSTRTWRELGAAVPASKGGRSRYELALPAAPARLDGLEILPETGFVQRRFRLLARVEGGEEREIAHGRFSARLERPAPLDVAFAPARVTALVLEVGDGDESPLALRAARARFVLPELYLVAPPGRYALLVGHPDAAAPSYALASVRDVVLAVSAAPAAVEPLEDNPAFRASARLAADGLSGGLGRSLLVWLALGAAVAVLVVMTLRLVRREEGPGS